jgi:hypothetical protein
MKTTNALVTYTDLSTMSLVPKGSPATGDRIATVSFINANYYVNQSAYPYNTYTSLRCPPYQTITPGPTNSGTLYYLITGSYPGDYGGFDSCEEACAHVTGGSVTVYWYGTLGLYTYLYMDPDGIIGFDGGGLFSLNGYCVGFDASVIIQIDVCAPPTTTTTTAASYTISWSLTDVTTGTATLEIVKNGSAIVIQSGDGSGSFSVTPSDVISYNLSATSPNFTYAEINDSVYGTISDCNFNSAFVNNFPGNSYSSNASINGIAIDYVDGCP